MNIDKPFAIAYQNLMKKYHEGEIHRLVPVIRDKLLKLIDKFIKEGYSQEKIGEMCGLSKVHISTLLSGRRGRNLTLNVALKIWEGLGNPPETLLGPPVKQPIITVVGQVPEVPSWVRVEDYLAVPLVEGRIAAGTGRIVGEEISDLVWVYRPEIGQRRNLVAVKLAPDADSMEPTLHPGDIVIVDRDDKVITPRGIYAVRMEPEGCAIKRVRISQGRIWLISDNNLNYPPEPADTDDLDALLIGRVIWSWTSWLR